MARKQTPEGIILQQVREALEWSGWLVIRHHQSLGSYRGLSDLTAIRAGRTVWIEVKTARGVLSEHQCTFRDAIRAAGGEYREARSLGDIGDLLGVA